MAFSRQRRLTFAICGAALAAAGLLLGQACLVSELSWTHREAAADSLIGFNFSCDQAEYLLLEDPALGEAGYVSDDRPGRVGWCAGVLDRLFEETGAKAIRLSVQWDEIQPAADRYDFELMEALFEVARERGASVSVSVGMKAQRHPEYYIPAWALEGTTLEEGAVLSEGPVLRERALEMIATVVQRFAPRMVIDSWAAENEPYIRSWRSGHWRLSREYAAEVVRLIHETDPSGRPVVINHAEHFVMDKRWKDALADADILGQSIYPRRNVSLLGFDFQANIMELGPLMPNYAYQARVAREAGKQLWVTELQAEPWDDDDLRLISPESPSPNLSPKQVGQNVIYARKTGAERIYLWGAEWWLYQADEFGDRRWLDAARAAVSGE